eukprot:3379021-Amphidinium_carterae.2
MEHQVLVHRSCMKETSMMRIPGWGRKNRSQVGLNPPMNSLQNMKLESEELTEEEAWLAMEDIKLWAKTALEGATSHRSR